MNLNNYELGQLTSLGGVVIGGLKKHGLPSANVPPVLPPIPDFIPDALIDLGLAVATEAHRHQKRNGTGLPYITHPVAVAEQLVRSLKVLGLTHDVMEDNPEEFPLSRIQNQFDDWVWTRLVVLTKRDNEAYDEYLLRIIATRDWAIWEVKRQDLRHNLSDLKPGSLRDKYRLAIRMLGEVP